MLEHREAEPEWVEEELIAVICFRHALPYLNPQPRRNLMKKKLTMIQRIFMTLLTMLSIVGAAATVTGCNTVEGAGQDIEKAGGAISDEAREHK